MIFVLFFELAWHSDGVSAVISCLKDSTNISVCIALTLRMSQVPINKRLIKKDSCPLFQKVHAFIPDC